MKNNDLISLNVYIHATSNRPFWKIWRTMGREEGLAKKKGGGVFNRVDELEWPWIFCRLQGMDTTNSQSQSNLHLVDLYSFISL